MLGKRDTSDYKKFFEAVKTAKGNYYGVVENKEIFDYEKFSDTSVAVFKQFDEKFDVTFDFGRLNDFFLKHQNSWVLPLEELAVTRIFKERKPALFLFSKDPNAKYTLIEASLIIRHDFQLVYADITSAYHQKLSSILGLFAFKMPFALILSENFEKFLHFGKTTPEGIIKFYENWKNSLAEVYYKSEKEIVNQKDIIRLNGKDFYDVIGQDNTLVYFYIPDCGYCKLFNAEYEILAEQVKSYKNIKIASIDYSKNDIKSLKILEFPKILYFSKGTYQEYSGNFESSEILKFLDSQNNPLTQKLDL